MAYENLLGGASATLLPEDPAAAELSAGGTPDQVVRVHPTSSLTWAVLAEQALGKQQALEAYAFARVGYHRGPDALRRNGWRGHGPVPWAHEPNRGFLRALAALAKAAQLISDTDEAVRCRTFLSDCDPAAAEELG